MKKKIFIVSFIAALLAMIVLMIIDSDLQNGNYKFGIVSFELAGSLSASDEIIQEWEVRGVSYLASFSLGFDYLYLVLYVSFLGLWTSVMADTFKAVSSKRVAQIIIFMFILAGILDAIENYALFKLLAGSQENYYSLLAYYCAFVKFSLIALGLVYNIAISAGRLIRRN